MDDIDLTNENLLELKQFQPNEPVMVLITQVQVSLSECIDDKKHLSMDCRPNGAGFVLAEMLGGWTPFRAAAKQIAVRK